MRHIDVQGARGASVGLEGNRGDPAGVAYLGGRVDLLRQGIATVRPRREIRACSAAVTSHCLLVLLLRDEHGHHRHVARRHEEPAVVHHRDHVPRVARLEDVPRLEHAAGVRCGRQRDDVAGLQRRGVVGAHRAVRRLVQSDHEALREHRSDGHVAVRHRELVVRNLHRLVVGVLHDPFNEEVALVRRRRQSHGVARVGRRRGGRDRAALGLGHRDAVAGERLEVGHVAAARRHVERDARLGRHHSAVLRPVDEHVARVRRRRQRHGGALVVAASARHRAALRRVGRRLDHVAVAAEVRHVRCGLRHSEAVARVAGHHDAALRPVQEAVAGVRRRGQRDVRAFLEAASARHRAASLRVGAHADVVVCARALRDVAAKRDALCGAARGEDEGLVVVAALGQTVLQADIHHLLDTAARRRDAQRGGVGAALGQADLVVRGRRHRHARLQVPADDRERLRLRRTLALRIREPCQARG